MIKNTYNTCNYLTYFKDKYDIQETNLIEYKEILEYLYGKNIECNDNSEYNEYNERLDKKALNFSTYTYDIIEYCGKIYYQLKRKEEITNFKLNIKRIGPINTIILSYYFI